MNNAGRWTRAVSQPFCTFTRIVRSTRRALETVQIDAGLLIACAHEQQAILVDRCDMKQVAGILRDTAHAISEGIVWVVTGSGDDHRHLRAEIERHRITSVVHTDHPQFRYVSNWQDHGLRLYLSSIYELRSSGEYNARRRADVVTRFCPLFVVVDSDLELGRIPFGSTFDPAWVVRDAMSRLCAVQDFVPLLILTQRDVASINPGGVRRAFGMSGLLYFEPCNHTPQTGPAC